MEEKRKTTTPSKEQIVERAKELYVQECYRNGTPELADVNPELSELRESGLLAVAQSELMRDRARHEVETWQDYVKETENLNNFTFDVKEGMATTSFVSGSRGVGKSDVAMKIVDKLSDDDVICIVFDSSVDWLKRSSIRQYLIVKPNSDFLIPKQNMIFDLSMLTPMEQQKTVENFNKKLFEFQVLNNSKNRYCVVYEESQNYFPLNALRSKRCQNSMRLLTVGRNFGITVCAISQFTATVDKELIKNSGQIYIGMTSEKNAVDYWQYGILGDRAKELKALENGEFLYYCRNRISKIRINPYDNSDQKKQIIAKTAPTPQQPTQPIQTKPNYAALLKFIVVSAIALAFLWSLI